nr:acyl carrier protein 1, chloroplastic-like [Tanacetum cinerariifolium]
MENPNCLAKPKTVNRVCELLKTQLAFLCSFVVAPDSKLSAVGADSLDTELSAIIAWENTKRADIEAKLKFSL